MQIEKLFLWVWINDPRHGDDIVAALQAAFSSFDSLTGVDGKELAQGMVDWVRASRVDQPALANNLINQIWSARTVCLANVELMERAIALRVLPCGTRICLNLGKDTATIEVRLGLGVTSAPLIKIMTENPGVSFDAYDHRGIKIERIDLID